MKRFIENGEAVELAKSLFKEDLEGFSRSIVSPIIGTNDAFHKKVLIAYMECFDFSKVSLDEAFRYCVWLNLRFFLIFCYFLFKTALCSITTGRRNTGH